MKRLPTPFLAQVFCRSGFGGGRYSPPSATLVGWTCLESPG
jgi:hypothetical protein